MSCQRPGAMVMLDFTSQESGRVTAKYRDGYRPAQDAREGNEMMREWAFGLQRQIITVGKQRRCRFACRENASDEALLDAAGLEVGRCIC